MGRPAHQSECRPGGPYGAPRKANRSAAADVFAAAYQSECRPGGPYGALKGTKALRLRALSFVLLATLATFPATAADQGRDVEVELEQFGVGSDFRASDVTGIALRLTSSLREPTPCFVQWEIPNADGDIA